MACSICNKAGHDEELHGDEGQELLQLREDNRRMRIALNTLLIHTAGAETAKCSWVRRVAKEGLGQ